VPSLEELDLYRQMKKGDENAQDAVVSSHIPWIASIARSLCNDPLKLADVSQVGALALLECIGTFDPEKGYTLSSYSSWHVRGRMLDYLGNKDKQVPLPKKIRRIIRRLKRATEQLHELLGREPSIKEITKRTGLSEEIIREAEQAIVLQYLSQLEELPEDDSPASDWRQPDEEAAYAHLAELLEDNLSSTLDPREIEILTWRYLVDPDEIKTLEELSDQLGIGITRVATLERRALRKLIRRFG
jgi:RNA polymerase sigma factor (sigma-70 family)